MPGRGRTTRDKTEEILTNFSPYNRGTRTRSIQTARHDPILLLESFNLFNSDLMTPPVAKIIFVDHLHVFLPGNSVELHAPIILHLYSSVGVLRVGFPVVRLSNDE